MLEEVVTQEEVGELAEKILDHLASADPGAAPDEPQRLEAASPSSAVPLRMARAIWKSSLGLRRRRRDEGEHGKVADVETQDCCRRSE